MTIRFCLLMASLVVPGIATGQTPPPPLSVARTYTDTVTPDIDKRYVFVAAADGQMTATLSWDNQTSDLMVILVCVEPGPDGEPLTFAIGAGRLDRTARFETGIFGGLTCLVQVSTLNGAAAFRLNLQMSTDQLAMPYAPLRVAASRDSGTERRLREHASATTRALQSRPR
jgi:hypothetical protein